MKDAVHPGSLIEPLILTPAGLSQSALARHLGFNQPQPVNELVKGKRGITPKMAILMERVTEGSYPAEFWLLVQLRYDLAQNRAALPDRRSALVQGTYIGSSPSTLRKMGQQMVLKLSKQL